MEIPANLSENSSTDDINAYAVSELHRAMLGLWDRMNELATKPDPSPIEVNAAIEEFSIAWQMITGIEAEDNTGQSATSRKETLPETFGGLLYKRLRLQFLEFQKKHGH
jgi:hypothetical protein